MKTILNNLLLMLAALICLCSCEVDWVNPISDTEDAKVDKRLIGTWVPKVEENGFMLEKMYHIYEIDQHSMYVYIMKTMDSMNPDAACVEEYGKMHVSEVEGRTFVNVRGYDCSTKEFGWYLILEYEFNDEDEVIFYYTNDNFIKVAIENKWLSGNKKGEDLLTTIVVTATSAEIQEFIKNSPKEELFNRDAPIILKRFDRPKDTKRSICILF